MLICKSVAPFTALVLLTVTRIWAQAPAPAATQPAPSQEVKVSIEVPKAVNVVREYGQILLSNNDDQEKLQRLKSRFRKKTDKSVVDVTVTVPRNWLTRKLGLVK